MFIIFDKGKVIHMTCGPSSMGPWILGRDTNRLLASRHITFLEHIPFYFLLPASLFPNPPFSYAIIPFPNPSPHPGPPFAPPTNPPLCVYQRRHVTMLSPSLTSCPSVSIKDVIVTMLSPSMTSCPSWSCYLDWWDTVLWEYWTI